MLGGSHDGTYSTVRGLVDASGGQPASGLNFDAHPDVKDRPDIGSGTPFGKLLREGFLRGENFVELGLHSNLTTEADYAFLLEQKVKIVRLRDIHRNQSGMYWVRTLLRDKVPFGSPAFLSFDLDCIASAYAPGVSAPSAEGLAPDDAVWAAFGAGEFQGTEGQQVRLFEVVELNPIFDRDNQTARLAATIITAYLTGVANRLAAQKRQ